ncbi:hypothetical protein [Streptomyces viridochromogenes]|uniref:hypothetical protein n=1 Tax=Streptomyces viridochromogenes TaxID=1938 RepID=UPI00069EC49C
MEDRLKELGASYSIAEKPFDIHVVEDGRLTITEVRRSSSQTFLTVRGTLRNEGSETAVVPAQLRGNELEIVRNGPSLGGATLVDTAERKVYYVLRDTDGRPLTTTGLSLLKAGETVPVYMQFPAPPQGTADVEFRLPTFVPVPLRLPT